MGAYDSEFVDTVGGSDELMDFIVIYFILLFLYRFSFHLVSDTFVLCFCFKGDKKSFEDVGFNYNIKDSSVKDSDDDDEALKDSNLAFFKYTNLVSFWFRFGFCLVSDNLFCAFVLRVIRNYLKILVLIAKLKIFMLNMVMKR